MRRQVGSRMRVGFLAMAALLVAGGLVTIFYTYRLQHVTTRLLADNLSSLAAAQELEVSLFRMRGLTSSYILDGDPGWLDTLEERKLEFRASLAKAHQTARSPEERNVLAALSALFAEYERDQKEVLALNRSGQSDKAKHLLAHATRDVFESIYQNCEAFVVINEGFMVAAVDRIRSTNRTLRAAMYGLGLGGLAMGYILGAVIARSIERPIYELVLKVRGAAGDEWVERLDVARGTELEELDRHVHELIRRINATRADLEKNRRLLARADKLAALGKLSAGIAHEIRNPLTSIKMLIYSLREDLASDDERRRDLDVIVREVDRMDRFVKSFLDFARPPEPSLSPVSINEVVHETMELLGPRLRHSGTQLVERYGPDAGFLMADSDQVKQVVMNLALNAIEAMPEGGTLCVETQRIAEAARGERGGWVQIRLSDTGAGIPEEMLDDIFDPFVSGREDGTGLGLAVSHQIVQRHKGWIDVMSAPGRGATFTVSLPDARG